MIYIQLGLILLVAFGVYYLLYCIGKKIYKIAQKINVKDNDL